MSAHTITEGEATGSNILFVVVLSDFKVDFEPVWRSNRAEVKCEGLSTFVCYGHWYFLIFQLRRV